MIRRVVFRFFVPALAGIGISCSPQPTSQASAAGPRVADLTSVTGTRAARLAWLEVASDAAAEGPARTRVFGYDAAGGQGLRALTQDAADYARPLLSHDGSAVIYTRLHARQEGGKTVYAPEVIRQAWGETTGRVLGAGMAVALWRDPVSGTEFVYAVESLRPGDPGRLTGEKLLRFLPEEPDTQEILWTATPLGTEQLQISRDGRRAVGCFPFPKVALANLTDQTMTPLAAGSWPAGAPDDSYAAAVLDGSRRRLRFFAPNLDPGWELTFMGAPGWQDGGVLHPRWSNDPGLLVFTGPHAADETAGDLCIVRFRDDFRGIQQTLRVTEGRRALSPVLWVEAGDASLSSLPQQPVVVPPPEPKAWPVSAEDLVFAWDSFQRKEPMPKMPGILTRKGFAVTGRYFTMEAGNGWFETGPETARDIAAACAASSAWSMELTLTERPVASPVSVRLAALMLEDGREAFALYRVNRKLVLRLLLGGAAERPAQVYPVVLTNLAIESDRPVHLLMALRNNRLVCWLDGQLQQEFLLESSGLTAWKQGTLSFGDPAPYGNAWSGTLERIGLWSRALTDEEIRQAADVALAWVEPRKLPLRVLVRAKPGVDAAVPPPGPDPLLEVRPWDIVQVVSGQLEAKRVAVAAWSRLQGQAVPPLSGGAGPLAELVLEAFDDHPELEAVARLTSSEAEDLPLFFNPRAIRPAP